MRLPTLSTLLSLLATLSHALQQQQSSSSFSLQILPSPALPNPATLPPSTHATLTSLSSPVLSARLTPANGFLFRNVSAGSYLLDVHCATHVFAPLRVDVDADGGAVGGGGVEGEGKEGKEGRRGREGKKIGAWDTFRGNDWDNRGEARGRNGKFEIRAIAGKNYFLERPKFSVLSLLKNPMILMAIFGGGMFMVMPYLMDNMDPEMRAEFEASQKSNPMSALLGGGGGGGGAGGFDMAEYLSGAGASKKNGGGDDGGDGGNNGGGNSGGGNGGGSTQKGKNKIKK